MQIAEKISTTIISCFLRDKPSNIVDSSCKMCNDDTVPAMSQKQIHARHVHKTLTKKLCGELEAGGHEIRGSGYPVGNRMHTSMLSSALLCCANFMNQDGDQNVLLEKDWRHYRQ